MKHLFAALPAVIPAMVLFACEIQPGADQKEPAGRAEAKSIWTIGIYTGASPFEQSNPENVRNPVLTAADVTDFDADIVAHPFMVVTDSLYYLFFTAKYGPTGLF